ncbi:MAG: hypothetical protein ACFFEE_13015, partial [Candidatus Thorarchaeota archaeon]
MKEITVAELVCTGEQDTEGRYSNPYVKIDIFHANGEIALPTQDTIVHNMDLLEGHLLLRAPILFREASEYIDEPSYRMSILDENGFVIDEVVQDNILENGDIYNHFDWEDSILEYVIPNSEFRAGEEKVIYLRFEVTLDLFERVDIKYKGNQVIMDPPLYDSRDIKLKITAADVEPVDFTPSVTSEGYHDYFKVKVKVDNQSSEIVQYKITAFKGTGITGDIEDLIGGPYWTHDPTRDLNPITHQSNGIYVDWSWYSATIPWYTVTGPMTHGWQYTVQCILEKIGDDEIFRLYNLMTIPEKLISVPVNKHTWASQAEFCFAIVRIGTIEGLVLFLLRLPALVAAATGATVAATGLIGTIVAGLIAAGPYLLILILGVAAIVAAASLIGSYLHGRVVNECPIQIDQDYKNLIDFRQELGTLAKKLDAPVELQPFMESTELIAEVIKSIRGTYIRFMTAKYN